MFCTLTPVVLHLSREAALISLRDRAFRQFGKLLSMGHLATSRDFRWDFEMLPWSRFFNPIP